MTVTMITTTVVTVARQLHILARQVKHARQTMETTNASPTVATDTSTKMETASTSTNVQLVSAVPALPQQSTPMVSVLNHPRKRPGKRQSKLVLSKVLICTVQNRLIRLLLPTSSLRSGSGIVIPIMHGGATIIMQCWMNRLLEDPMQDPIITASKSKVESGKCTTTVHIPIITFARSMDMVSR